MNRPFRHCYDKALDPYKDIANFTDQYEYCHAINKLGFFKWNISFSAQSSFQFYSAIKLIQFKMKSKILNLIFLWDITCACIFALILQYHPKHRKFYHKKVFEIMINSTIMYIRFIKKKITDYNVKFIISDSFGLKTVVCSVFYF